MSLSYPQKRCSGTAKLLLPLGSVVLAIQSRLQDVSAKQLSVEILPTDNKPIQKDELVELLQPNLLVQAQLSPDNYEVSISSQSFKIQSLNSNPHQYLEVILSCVVPNQEYKDFVYELTQQ